MMMVFELNINPIELTSQRAYILMNELIIADLNRLNSQIGRMLRDLRGETGSETEDICSHHKQWMKQEKDQLEATPSTLTQTSEVEELKTQEVRNNEISLITRSSLMQFFSKLERQLEVQVKHHDASDVVLVSKLHLKQIRKESPSNSKYIGVVPSKRLQSWGSHIYLPQIKRQLHLGSFNLEQQAAQQYDKSAIQLHGLKAKTNFNYTKKEVLELLDSRPLVKIILEKYA